MIEKIRNEIKRLESMKETANQETKNYLNAKISGLEFALRVVVTSC